MIISHKYKFIFIKTAKTAGTSIEIALSKHLGENDVITPIAHGDELIRSELGYPGPQNCWLPFYKDRPKTLLRKAIKRKRRLRYYNSISAHINASGAKRLVDKDTWDNYYKFCFARNPWDRAISYYYWCHRSEPRPSFSEFVRSRRFRKIVKKGWKLYTINGNVVVDRVCAYENLQEELEHIRKTLGIPEPLEVPSAKSQHRGKISPEDLSQADKHIVQKVSCAEALFMGYEMPA